MQHIIGLPRKNNEEKPLFDFEKLLYKALFEPGFLNNSPKLRSDDPNNILYPFKEKHLYIKKSTGLGISTFFLRLMAWAAQVLSLPIFPGLLPDQQRRVVVAVTESTAVLEPLVGNPARGA